MSAASQIRCVPASCPLCAAPGPHPVRLAVRRLSPFNRDSPACRIDVVRCSGCGLLRLDPRPDDEALARLQQDSLGDAASQIGSFEAGNANPEYPPMLAARLRAAGFPASAGRLLDVGCGGGELLHAMASALGAEATGLDVSAAALTRARSRFPQRRWVLGRVEPATLPAGGFHGATLIHVLEHLPDPLGALAAIRSWLEPGGLLAVEVPNGEFYFSRWYGALLELPKPWLARLARLRGRRVAFTSRGFYPYHLSLFGPRSLDAMIRRAGFEVLDLDVSTCRLEWWLAQNRRQGDWPRLAINRLKLALARRGLGDNLLVLARRPSEPSRASPDGAA